MCVPMRSTHLNPSNGIALEVEAGRAMGGGNAVYRDLIETSLIVDARYLTVAVPLLYRPNHNERCTGTPPD